MAGWSRFIDLAERSSDAPASPNRRRIAVSSVDYDAKLKGKGEPSPPKERVIDNGMLIVLAIMIVVMSKIVLVQLFVF